MNRKSLLSPLALAAAFFAPAVLHAADPDASLARHFGAHTVYFVEKAAQPEINSALEKSPLNDLFANEDFRTFTNALLLAPLHAALASADVKRDPSASLEETLREFTGLSTEDLNRLLNGRLAGGVTLEHPERLARILREVSARDDDEETDSEADLRLFAELGAHFSLVIEHDGQEELLSGAFKRLVEKANEDEPTVKLDTRTEGAFEIFELNFDDKPDPPIRFLAALGSNRAVISVGGTDPADMMARLVGAEQTLADSALYLEAREALPSAQFRLLLNPGNLLDTLVRHGLTEAFSENPMLAGMLSPPNQIADSLRVDAFTGIFASFAFDDLGAFGQAGITYDRDGGLIGSILGLNRSGPLPRMDYVPRDVTAMSASTFSMGALLALIERAVAQISPLYANVYEGFKMQLRGESGIDLDSMLLRNLTSGVVNFSRPLREDEIPDLPPDLPPGMPTAGLVHEGTIYGISLHEGARLVDGLDRARESFPAGAMFEKGDFLDIPLYMSPMAEAQGVQQGLAVADDVLVFGQGSLNLLRESLTLWKSPGTSLMDEPHMEEFLRGLPSNVTGIAYADINSLLRTLFTVATFSMQGSMGAMGADDNGIDLPPMPDLSSQRFHSHSVSLDVPSGLRTDIRITRKDD